MEEHLEDLVANPGGTLRQMQRTFHGQNCPAVAAAVHRYLLTGEAHQAGDNLGGGFVCTPPLHTRNSMTSFVNIVGGGTVGNCAVIGTSGGRPSHYFNLVNLNETVYFVDAFTGNPIFEPQGGNLVSGFSQFEFFRDFSCQRA